ncbi:hypothetical protein OG342_14915 [Streptomyces bobili]|uniref:hypothetical protein n=1 Tax=Streptomyces bobili TaxID=67280 RepID=UPI0022513153|nr:hypothetical protein [Streptomyces bobili]MCX5524146.1 hypothetical protein [Streptomyces bobili]
MRTVLALILSWLMPSTGKRRAAAEGVDTVGPIARTADEPTIALRAGGVVRPASRSTWPTPLAQDQDHFGVIVADGLPLVRPYVIQNEQERERQRQRDRRTAATLATIGIDFHGATV